MNPKNSQDLFNKIRSQFSNIRLGDENGAATADPSSAVFFEFEFQEDADTFGSVSISLADGENMKVYYNRNLVNKIDEDSKDEWYAFLKELKDYAVEHQMGFDVRDITKNNLTKQDYENLADTNKTVNTDEMSEELARITKLAGVEKAPVAEGLTGTSKSSFENLNKTKLIIRHKGKVDETVPGARSRQIQSLYIENEDGERFKYPMTHLAGARAMMRHVANGGRPHDEFGQHIVSTSEDIAKLNSFSRYASNKDQLNDNAGDIIEQTKLKLENLRGYMKNLSNQTHYENASKDFKTSEEQILDDETVNKLREKFTMKNLDSRVEDAFPIINKIMSEFEATKEQEQVNELDPGKNFEKKDKETVPTVLPKDAEPIDAPIQAPVDHGAIVQGYLSDPDSKLILRKDDTADKMLKITKFKDKNTMLSSILSDIASRLISTPKGEEDRVANFASRVADEMDQEKSAAFKPSADYIKNKKIAVQLAKRYIDDYKKMQSEPGYTDQVRKDPQEINKFKNIKGQSYGDKGAEYKAPSKETEAFESWVDETVNEYAKMGDYPIDKEIEKKDKENATKLDVTKADKMMNTTAYKRMQAGDERYADKTEGNQFAQAVQKAKAAGMKAGDKFKVGADEYTLKDAIEMAGLQLEEFFSEEEMEVPAEAQAEAEAINTELDRIKTLANIA
jgi:nicotinamide mononucleotide adenylyltransferase